MISNLLSVESFSPNLNVLKARISLPESSNFLTWSTLSTDLDCSNLMKQWQYLSSFLMDGTRTTLSTGPKFEKYFVISLEGMSLGMRLIYS